MAVVIEDEDDIRHLLETVLTQAGFMVVATSNGLDGLAAVRMHNPVVTTLDVNMPGMDGFETARRIREFSSTYIVMLTALNEEIDTLQGLEAGADDYVNKPFRPRELRARIEAMLRRPRMDAATPAQSAPEAPTYSAPPQAAAPVYAQPAQTAPAQTAPAQTAPAQTAPVQGTPVQSAPVQSAPVQPTNVQPAYVEPAEPVPTTAPSIPVWGGAAVPPAPSASAPSASAPSASASSAPAAPVAAAPIADDGGSGWLAHNGLALNVGSRVVKVDGAEVELTRSEFDLLVAILDSHRRVKSKADLVLLLRGESYVTSHFVSDADKRAIEVHMANLRKKLGDNLATPRWIETVRGVGYRLTATDS